MYRMRMFSLDCTLTLYSQLRRWKEDLGITTESSVVPSSRNFASSEGEEAQETSSGDGIEEGTEPEKGPEKEQERRDSRNSQLDDTANGEEL